MRSPLHRLAAFLPLCIALPCLAAEPVHHDFIAIDEGLGNLLRVDQSGNGHDWLVPIGHPRPRDLQLVGAGRLLLSHDKGYSEFDLTTGKRLIDVASFSNVSSARRLENGDTLVAYAVEGKAAGIFVAELNARQEQVALTTYPGDYVRLMRQTDRGTFLFGMNDHIAEGDGKGALVWTAKADGFRHAWKAIRLATGDTLASAGYGAFMVEFAPDGTIVRRFGGAGDVPATVHPFFYGTFQLLPGGDVVVANWQGHGAGHGSSGVQLVEFDPKGVITWQWSERSRVSSIQGVLVLDGLDTALLHDERRGLTAPLSGNP
ncbi:MAG TPA: hypothetical protein VFE25_12190 [Opitutaceae bacterium]|nr:hypothetical protein [Opitutaceae bacterium]